MNTSLSSNTHIAIVGMSGRFPPAGNIQDFWENLHNSRECITFFTDNELLNGGIRAENLAQKTYVKARGKLGDVDTFDARFFNLLPHEARLLDPQQRLMLECSWEACEHAGYMMEKRYLKGAVYVGQRMPTYYMQNLLPAGIRNHPDLDKYALAENSSSNLAARIAHCLQFNGPTVAVQTACSTSLVAVHLAAQSLLSLECDIAVAGGVAVTFPQVTGYWYHEGGIGSPDGHVRAFDERAGGTVGGDGCGAVVLRRMNDAVRDGDTIHAVILGSAVSNDGNRKVGFTAPSVSGQIEVILEALEVAEISASQISYVEAHGTGTVLGDPLELLALSEAYGSHGVTKQSCYLGSVKSNMGHLDAAAGVAGLIKTILALKHDFIPASLHFRKSSSQFDLEHSPFHVVQKGQSWPKTDSPRKAAVSSFGMGGTNAHVIIEEAPEAEPTDASGPFLLSLSANSERALQQQMNNLKNTLCTETLSLRDVEYTLQMGRKDLPCRAFIITSTADEAIRRIAQHSHNYRPAAGRSLRQVAFFFLGQGTMDMARIAEMYVNNAYFSKEMASCQRYISRLTECDLTTLLATHTDSLSTIQTESDFSELRFLRLAAEYSLARLWMKMGLQPSAVIGCNMGLLTAACIAGLLSCKEMFDLARTMPVKFQEGPLKMTYNIDSTTYHRQGSPPSGIRLWADKSNRRIFAEVDCDHIEQFHTWCDSKGITRKETDLKLTPSPSLNQSLPTTLSRILQKSPKNRQTHLPIFWCVENPEEQSVSTAQISQYVSCLPSSLVELSDCLRILFEDFCLLETGFTKHLQAFENCAADRHINYITSFDNNRHTGKSTHTSLLNKLGTVWKTGAAIDWSSYNDGIPGRRIPLPPSWFDKTRCHIEPGDSITKKSEPFNIQ